MGDAFRVAETRFRSHQALPFYTRFSLRETQDSANQLALLPLFLVLWERWFHRDLAAPAGNRVSRPDDRSHRSSDGCAGKGDGLACSVQHRF